MRNGDFFKGIFLGILMAGIVVLALFLMRFGTLGSKRRDASVLTDADTTRKLNQVQYLINESFLEDIDPQLLETYMFKGIAAGLNDEYANYYSAEEYEQVQRENEGSYFGIGVVFAREDEMCVIQEVYPDSPAERAGIMAGDVLLAVNGEQVDTLSFQEAMDLIRLTDPEDTIGLTLQRDGETVELTCGMEEVMTAEITWEVSDDGIGYLRIPEFDRVSVQQFEDALDEISSHGAQGLIIDLRGNPGGLLESVTVMLDDMLDECLLITTRSRGEKEEKIYAEDGTRYSGEVVVLTNENSASASEVFAGTLQYYKAAYLIGETTFGKGVVQSTWQLSDGSALKMTTEKYYIAGEVEIDKVGVTPDLIVSADETAGTSGETPEEAEEEVSGGSEAAADVQRRAAEDYLRGIFAKTA